VAMLMPISLMLSLFRFFFPLSVELI
jgi:hypothetical protein